jgi:hypothetical protein
MLFYCFQRLLTAKTVLPQVFFTFFYFCVSASLEIPALGLEFHTCA